MPEKILAEQIANQLRRDILRGILPPGASIKERDNAAEMGVSRTPMREAIRILAKEGLVLLRPSRSPIVARPAFEEVADQVAVLVALEKLSAELACREAGAGDLAQIRAILDEMDRNFDQADPLDMFEIDMSFHSAIALASHNAALVETHTSYLQRLWHARYLAAIQRRNRDRVIRQHTRIVEAIEAGDPEAARDAIGVHMQSMTEDIRTVIAEETAKIEKTDIKTGETT